MTSNSLYLEKRLRVLVSGKSKSKTGTDSKAFVVSIIRNIESLGYIFSKKLALTLSRHSEDELASFYSEILPVLKQMRGAHRSFNPMYPNFPKQVVEMSNLELYWNAFIHYFSVAATGSGALPQYEKTERLPLTEGHSLDVIDIGTQEDFDSMFGTILSAKTSVSESDKTVLRWFISNYRKNVMKLLPLEIPMKENIALLIGELLKLHIPLEELSRYVKTPTDVLRIVTILSGGDVSLVTNCKFVKMSRPLRRLMLTFLENSTTELAEDMVKYRSRWIRVGEKLHPGEFVERFPRTAAAFKSLREDKSIETFNTRVERSLLDNEVKEAVKLLVTRPGVFARRLDQVFRMSPKQMKAFAEQFIAVADNVATPVLLQVYNHFKTRNSRSIRVAFPKGQLSKARLLEDSEPLNDKFCQSFAADIREVLVERFKKLEKLGTVYVDSSLKNFVLPFSQRSASKALRTLVRGSRIDLDTPEQIESDSLFDTVRFFVWWKNIGSEHRNRVDIDLTAALLDENFKYVSDISYYNLKQFEGHHSGDIITAPKGAAEFIDISLDKVIQKARYIAMTVQCYTNQTFDTIPEVFAGWMLRKNPNSGEIFEPKTVQNRLDITSQTTIAIPLFIDAKSRQVIWADMGLKSALNRNNARNNSRGIGLTCRTIAQMEKPSMYDLLSMHVEARGQLVKKRETADVVFDTSDTSALTPYDIDRIVSEFM